MYLDLRPPSGHRPEDAQLYNLHAEPKDRAVGAHFRLREFACQDGTPIVILHQALVYHLDRLRERFQSAVYVTSGFRTAAYNASVQGRDNSTHLWGGAADVIVDNTPPEDVQDWAEDQGFGGVGRYEKFTHLDVWKEGRRWSG